MSNTKPHTRVFALLGAVLFFVTSIALTIAVLWQIHQDSRSTSTTATSQSTSTKTQGGKLQGTKLTGFKPVSSVPSLEITDTKIGTGQAVQSTNTITAHYTGAVASNGVIFQSSHDSGQPATFALNKVIIGWQQGVVGMKVGGTRRIVIPASLAYGANPPSGSGIPANADLVFDIELVSIQQ